MYDEQFKYENALEYEIFIKGEYDFAKNEIMEANCIFDIWWHVWYFSQRCWNLNPNAKIHYFEPVGEFYRKAESILWNNRTVTLNNVWIGAKHETWTILVNKEKTMQSSKYSSFLNPKWTKIAVKFTTLKNYLEKEKIDKIDVLKMDIEWMEFEVLSSRWIFERWKIANLIIEIHLLNEKMKSEWDRIFYNIKSIFPSVQIIDWSYRKEIFLLWCKK